MHFDRRCEHHAFAGAYVKQVVSAPLHSRTCTSACAFLAESMHAFRQVL